VTDISFSTGATSMPPLTFAMPGGGAPMTPRLAEGAMDAGAGTGTTAAGAPTGAAAVAPRLGTGLQAQLTWQPGFFQVPSGKEPSALQFSSLSLEEHSTLFQASPLFFAG